MIPILLALLAQAAPDPDTLARRALALVRAKCAGCHGEDPQGKIKGGLDLRTREGLLKGGEDRGPSVVPGHPDRSPFLAAATWEDPDFRMPPKAQDRLSKEEVALLRDWIAAGAAWPEPVKEGVDWAAFKPGDVWAFQPVRKPAVPAGADHPVDAFLLAALRARGLVPAGPAGPATLVRRVTFDLTGLPPTPEEIAAFEADRAPGAWERLVDRLLASPRYGEQWARHWLDVVRYADTSGFSNDFERPNAWRYRDYVVRSFNADTPYARFVEEQIAGDELGDDPELLVAAGFLRMGPWEHTAMSVAAETRQYFLDDVTHSVAATFLGLTMRCARCHDHKFDPLPTRDYYRLQAVFAPVQFAERPAAFLASENVSRFARDRAEIEAWMKEKGYTPVGAAPDDPVLKKSLSKVGEKRAEHLSRELKRFEPLAFSVYNGPDNGYLSNRVSNGMPAKRVGTIQEISILRGGAIDSPGERVSPGTLSAIAARAEIPPDAAGRRLALARWITDPANPLSARVLVNRIWQHHFGGKGLVATPNNFGRMGRRPTHPELLDWLASEFIARGGSIKSLHRLILTSEAYRRSSSPPDPDASRRLDASNDLLGHHPPRRLAAEEIRDAMLAVTGELNPEAGGPGCLPEINLDVALQPRHVMGGPAPSYQPSRRPEDRNRRTLYAFRIRTLADPLLEVFNRPGSEMSCERRDDTTVTPQAFSLFNGQFAHDRALALARRIESAGGPADRVRLAFRLVVARAPSAGELALCLAHVESSLAVHRSTPPVRADFPASVRREMIEELTGAVVRWDEILPSFRDYRRDLQPWDVGPETRALADLCLVLLNSNEFLYVR